MLLDNIIWLAIGFLPMYGAMELSWRLAKRIDAKGNKTGKEEETVVASTRSKVAYALLRNEVTRHFERGNLTKIY